MREDDIRKAYKDSVSDITASDEFKERAMQRMLIESMRPPVRSTFYRVIISTVTIAACALIVFAVWKDTTKDQIASTQNSVSEQFDDYVVDEEKAVETMAAGDNDDKTAGAEKTKEKRSSDTQDKEASAENAVVGEADAEKEESLEEMIEEETAVTTTAATQKPEMKVKVTAAAEEKTSSAQTEAAQTTAPAAAAADAAPAADEKPAGITSAAEEEQDILEDDLSLLPIMPTDSIDHDDTEEIYAGDGSGSAYSEEGLTNSGSFYGSNYVAVGANDTDGEVVEEFEEAADEGDRKSIYQTETETAVREDVDYDPKNLKDSLIGGEARVIFTDTDESHLADEHSSSLLINVLTSTDGSEISRSSYAPTDHQYIVDIENNGMAVRFYVSKDSVTYRTANEDGIIYITYNAPYAYETVMNTMAGRRVAD